MLEPHIRTQQYLNDQASKTRFIETAAQAGILHVASHSIVNEANPLFSRILFSVSPPPTTESENPVLTEGPSSLYAYELFDLNISPKIALFNACSSGSGNRMKGSGMLGFSRALLYAGTQGMLMNAWAITDAHALKLSNLFYRQMTDGELTTTAIRRAKLALLYSDNANPHYWGAFQYIGEPIRLQTTPLSSIYILSLVFFILLWATNQLRFRDAL
jgi:CHAT domain-containing protein